MLSIVPELPTPPPEEVTPRRWTAPVDILSHIPPDVPAVDIDLSGLVSGPIPAPDPDRAPGWLRFAMGALTLAAVVLGSLYVGGWRYPLLDARDEDVSAPAPQSDTPTGAPAAAGLQGAQRGPGAPSVAAKAIPDEPARHRRHHRRSSADGEGSVEKDTDVEDSDGVLPLSDEESSAQ